MRRFHFDWLLWNLKLVDMQELVDHGAIRDRDYSTWDTFCEDRLGWYLSQPAHVADAVFKALLSRTSGKEAVRSTPPPPNTLPFPKRSNK